MNVLLTPYAREERVPDQLLVGLRSYNPNDGFGRVGGDQLNFAAPSEDEAEYPTSPYLKKGKVSRQDPLSHRIIEKRRRDRMNNCLADLSRLIPPEYLKKGRGRVEKTEIIEMAIRHLKYLQDRVDATDRQNEDAFRAGYQEGVGQSLRFLGEQGYERDGLCEALNSQAQRHVEFLIKAGALSRLYIPQNNGSSSSDTSSSSPTLYPMKPVTVIIPPTPAPPPAFTEPYDQPPEAYAMDCDREPVRLMPEGSEDPYLEEEPLALDARRHGCPSPSLRAVRKPEHGDDYLHSYKFKNSIERRFSRSQDNELSVCGPEGVSHAAAAHAQAKLFPHKRRRGARPPPPASSNETSTETSTETSNSASGSNEDARDNSPQDTSSDSPAHHHYDHHQYDKGAPLPHQLIPVFALNENGQFYVPLTVEYSCLTRQGGSNALTPRANQLAPPLHPVTLNVNFHPCLDDECRVKREPAERDWRPKNVN